MLRAAACVPLNEHAVWKGRAVSKKLLFQVCGITGCLIGSALASADQLTDVIDAVRANELLFSDIDLTYRMVLEQPQQLTITSLDGQEMLYARNSDSAIHLVMQSGKIRGDRTGKKDLSNGEQATTARTIAYDGTTTRLVEQEAFGNIQDSKATDELWQLPHMWLLARTYMVSLSAYLSGHEAARAENASSVSPGWEKRISCVGNDTVAGLSCVCLVVESVHSESQQIWCIEKLWLARDRNFFPCRSECYMHKDSVSFPASVSEVLEWQQLDDTIWFPKRVVREKYSNESVKAGGRELAWSEVTEVSAVSLTPDYPDEYFAFTFPTGLTVYRLSSSSEIVDELTQVNSGALVPVSQAPAAYRESGELFRRTAAVIGGSVTLIVIAASVIYRRLRAETKAADR